MNPLHVIVELQAGGERLMTLRTVSSMSSFGSANELKLLPLMGEPICLLDYKLAAPHCSQHGRQCFNLRSANADDEEDQC